MNTAAPVWLAAEVSRFGTAAKSKLGGPGDKEAAICSPIDALLTACGGHIGVNPVMHPETRETDRKVRPDFSATVGGAVAGYIEVKAPGKSVDPISFTGHDLRQWEKQRDLPNLIYTNGIEWRHYRDGEPVGHPVVLEGGDLASAGASLTAGADFETLLRDFFSWKPAVIRSVGALVRAIAPLTRLLRAEVLDQLTVEKKAVKGGASASAQPFLGLAADWRALLFPSATDDTFADGYAQTVTFALLLARRRGVNFQTKTFHAIGADPSMRNSLMGRALQLLTDNLSTEFVTLPALLRVTAGVDWPAIKQKKGDAFLHLYEDFLEHYDPALRQQSGTYYTPRGVVEQMTRLSRQALIELGHDEGFASPAVTVVDPAMGTGTFLESVLDEIADTVELRDGPGAVAPAITDAMDRVYGFELQMGSYAVAQMRAADVLAKRGASLPAGGVKFYVTDTLDDPDAAQAQLGSGLRMIAENRKQANKVKANTPVTVVIGNPPYKEKAEGLGGWVEQGPEAARRSGQKTRAILDDYRFPGNGRHERHLKNLYVYFWRWATWKVWESTPAAPDGEAGIVCFISTSGFSKGPGFKGMRKYLRTWATKGWIIDLTPEGQTPEVATRIFPGVRQPLCIALFVRSAEPDDDTPAAIVHKAVHGRQRQKFEQLAATDLVGPEWRPCRDEWTAAFTPAALTSWDDYPAVDDLYPWRGPGIKASRTWPFAPSREILQQRWRDLIVEANPTERARLLSVSPGVDLDFHPNPLPGNDTVKFTKSLRNETTTAAPTIEVGFRAFDRQYLIPDARLMQRPGPLWAGRVPGQVFTVEQHADSIQDGPGLLFSALIPDLHHFNGRGGRALPMLHPNSTPNVAPGLLAALATEWGTSVDAARLTAYVAGIAAHPAFTQRFADELVTPGIRVPLTTDPQLAARVIAVGQHVLWCHTFGRAGVAPSGVSKGVRYGANDPLAPRVTTTIDGMPAEMTYDEEMQRLTIGTGTIAPVTRRVWDYEVGGSNVLNRWFGYRKAHPGGRRLSELNLVHATSWPSSWTTDLLDLITVLDRLTHLETDQARLLAEVMAAPCLSRDALSAKGVAWPSESDRKPAVTATHSSVAHTMPMEFPDHEA